MEIISDIDLSKKFAEPIFNDYSVAIEFINIKPDYSLLKFRCILEYFCSEAWQRRKATRAAGNLADRIVKLCESGIIDQKEGELLHKLRLLGNNGVHRTYQAESQQDKEFIARERSILQEQALQARRHAVDLLKIAHRILLGKELSHQIEMVAIERQEHKEMLYEAIVSTSAESKMRAGLLCESIADELAMKSPLVVSSELKTHLDSLNKMAAVQYEAAFLISARLDDSYRKMTEQAEAASPSDVAYRYCDPEPLFRYAMIALGGVLGEDAENKAPTLLKMAANKGYHVAAAYYGAHMYYEKNYRESLEYLTRAAEHDVNPAFAYLGKYYSEGLACKVDKDLALKYINQGVDLDCADALAVLGIVLHKGEICEKDDNKAGEALLRAYRKGSAMGKRYYIFDFKNLPERVADELQKLGKYLQVLWSLENDSEARQKVRPKPRPNEQCSCGSGKKFKKCCREKILSTTKVPH